MLGADHTFTTEVRAAAAPVGGVVAGDLYLVGGGDPLLTSSTYPVANDPNPVMTPTPLDALADALAAAGVTQIQGGVVGDGSRYDDEFFPPSWVNDIRGIEAGPYRRVARERRPRHRRPEAGHRPGAGRGDRADAAAAARGVDRRRGAGTGTAPAGAAVLARCSRRR